MKRIIIMFAFAMAILSLQSCGSYSSMSSEDAYKTGYNIGVLLNGGDSSEYLK